MNLASFPPNRGSLKSFSSRSSTRLRIESILDPANSIRDLSQHPETRFSWTLILVFTEDELFSELLRAFGRHSMDVLVDNHWIFAGSPVDLQWILQQLTSPNCRDSPVCRRWGCFRSSWSHLVSLAHDHFLLFLSCACDLKRSLIANCLSRFRISFVQSGYRLFALSPAFYHPTLSPELLGRRCVHFYSSQPIRRQIETCLPLSMALWKLWFTCSDFGMTKINMKRNETIMEVSRVNWLDCSKINQIWISMIIIGCSICGFNSSEQFAMKWTIWACSKQLAFESVRLEVLVVPFELQTDTGFNWIWFSNFELEILRALREHPPEKQ